ncbi:MAG: hypothetical protein ABIH37_05420 [archaeon]
MSSTVAKSNRGTQLGDRLMGYGGSDLEHPKFFIHTPPETTVETFLQTTRRGLLDRFIQSTQEAFSAMESGDIDTTYRHAYRARRLGRVLKIGGIDECTRHIMLTSSLEYIQSQNPNLEKARNYLTEFGINTSI